MRWPCPKPATSFLLRASRPAFRFRLGFQRHLARRQVASSGRCPAIYSPGICFGGDTPIRPEFASQTNGAGAQSPDRRPQPPSGHYLVLGQRRGREEGDTCRPRRATQSHHKLAAVRCIYNPHVWYIRGCRISAGHGDRLVCHISIGPGWSFLGQLGSRDGQRRTTSGQRW